MTTGRINQVAFLDDVDDRKSTDVQHVGHNGIKTAATVVRVKGQMHSLGKQR